MQRSTLTAWLWKLSLPVAGLGIALLAAELSLRAFAPEPQAFYVWPPHLVHAFTPAAEIMPGVVGERRIRVNSEGIRAREFGPAGTEYRILAVGGSTTDCGYLGDDQGWVAQLETKLGGAGRGRTVWAGNVGRSGHNSRDHVVQVKYLLRQLPGIDAVVVLVGANDMTVAMRDPAAYVPPPPITDAAAERAQVRRAFVAFPDDFRSPHDVLSLSGAAAWARSTALWRLARRARAGWVSAHGGLRQDRAGAVYRKWREHRLSAPYLLREVPDLGDAIEEYRRNLDVIIDLAQANGVRLILMTQPSLWRHDLSERAIELLWLGGTGDFQNVPGNPYYSPDVLARAIGTFNDALLGACRERSVECIDLAGRVPKTLDMFYDDIHFTDKGAATVAEIIAGYLRARPPFGDGSHARRAGSGGGGAVAASRPPGPAR